MKLYAPFSPNPFAVNMHILAWKFLCAFIDYHSFNHSNNMSLALFWEAVIAQSVCGCDGWRTIVGCLGWPISTFFPFLQAPASSPSPGGDVRAYVVDINQQNLPALFILFLCLFLSLWLFKLYFYPWILPTTLCFLTLFFWSYFCLIGSFNYICFYESLPRPWYNPLCLTGLKVPVN